MTAFTHLALADEASLRVLYVNAAARGAADGSSWLDAYRDLQDALDDARTAGDTDAEVWIAAGAYMPDRDAGDQTIAFELFGTVALYGGFAGMEDCRDERDPDLNITVLSGDLNGDDDSNAQSLSDCCSPLPPRTCSDADCYSTVLSIDPGCADRWTDRCTGFAVRFCCDLCRPTRCDNSYNVVRATEPGSAPRLDGLTIMSGEAYDPEAECDAGGLYAWSPSLRVYGCRFLQNRGRSVAALYAYGAIELEATTFAENGMRLFYQKAVTIDGGQPVTVKEVIVENNLGSGMHVRNLEATIVDSIFRDNAGLGLDCFRCTVARCKFLGNTEGAVAAQDTVWMIDSLFADNLDTAVFTWGPGVVINSVFANNTAFFAAALECGSAYVLNSAFYGNSATHVGGMWVNGGATIRNSVFWNNRDAYGIGAGIGMLDYPHRTPDVRYSILQNETQYYPGVGVIDVDPLFVDADGPDDVPGTEDDNLRLLPGSPAIDAGDPDETYLPITDLDGHARVLCGRVDMGAYEFGMGDYDCDQAVDLADFAAWESCMTGPEGPYQPGCEAFDFNADGAVDLSDFASFSIIGGP